MDLFRGYCWAGLVILSTFVHADSVSLSPTADTTIFDFNPDSNFGAETDLILGSVARNAPNNRARLLLQFDLSSIPAGALVTNVSLQLTVLKENAGEPPVAVGIHRMLTNWTEGDRTGRQGTAANLGQSTWNSRAHSQAAWGAPGGLLGTDFSTDSSSSQNLDGQGTYTFPSTATLVADVQGWLSHPEANAGWILMALNEATAASARRIRSREGTAGRPLLTIGYTISVEPQIVNFESVERLDDQVKLGFRMLAGNVYSIWIRDTLATPGWGPLTNMSSKFIDLDAVVFDPVANASRYYQLAITGQVD